jgi:undecaprenyl pyrophosphate phosphatase UppP
MGAVQGITEFLPISSSAHLIVISKNVLSRENMKALVALLFFRVLYL